MLGCTFGEKKIVINDADPWANDGENIYTIIPERGLVKISIGGDGLTTPGKFLAINPDVKGDQASMMIHKGKIYVRNPLISD